MAADPGDEAFFGFSSGVLIVAAVVLVGALALFIPPRAGKLPEPPLVLGCYSAPGCPDISIDQSHLWVHQQRPLKVPYELQYHKGWALAAAKGFDWDTGRDGEAVLRERAEPVFLFLSRELEVRSKVPQFAVFNQASLALQYVRVGSQCRHREAPDSI